MCISLRDYALEHKPLCLSPRLGWPKRFSNVSQLFHVGSKAETLSGANQRCTDSNKGALQGHTKCYLPLYSKVFHYSVENSQMAAESCEGEE